jgi:hypothetical protein
VTGLQRNEVETSCKYASAADFRKKRKAVGGHSARFPKNHCLAEGAREKELISIVSTWGSWMRQLKASC